MPCTQDGNARIFEEFVEAQPESIMLRRTLSCKGENALPLRIEGTVAVINSLLNKATSAEGTACACLVWTAMDMDAQGPAHLSLLFQFHAAGGKKLLLYFDPLRKPGSAQGDSFSGCPSVLKRLWKDYRKTAVKNGEVKVFWGEQSTREDNCMARTMTVAKAWVDSIETHGPQVAWAAMMKLAEQRGAMRVNYSHT